MGSSRERWSSSNRGGERDGVNGDGWSTTLGSSGSAGALKRKSKFLAPECNCYFIDAPTSRYPIMIKTVAPHCKYFAWLDDYVASCDKEVRKVAIHGRGKQNEGQEIISAQFDVKVKELEDIFVRLEMQLRDTKHAKYGSGFISIWLMVVAFVFGIVFGNVLRVLG
ncbi:hypothetical protein PIB30_087667 [Stylosanthes scabra]|uniref:Uncharacterized protein n=1 Tax=Stylosanthes scabra TaxID=79078 RepID=A0ABU6TSZ0_9FABA|nr:hypothetical protein [Stylosanthes scabra]